MSLELDHVIIAVDDLDTAIQDYQDLGFTTVRGGVHANRATKNALITFQDGTYLELLAATGEQPVPELVDFSILLQHGEGFVGFALRSDDLDVEVTRLRSDGFVIGNVIPGERRRGDGTLVRWKLALLDDGFAPFLIEDVTPRNWRISDNPEITTHPNGARGLRGIEIAVRNLTTSQARYTHLFGRVTIAAHAQQSVRLIETETEQAEALHALLLVLKHPIDHVFLLEKTHGVRFQPFNSPD